MSQGWHREDIIAAVRKRGTTLMALAKLHGYAPHSFYVALTRRFPNPHRIIADTIKESRHALWPQWYDANDKPLFRLRSDLVRRSSATLEKEAA